MSKFSTGAELPKQENLAVSIRLAKERLARLDGVAQARRAGCHVAVLGELSVAHLKLVGKPVQVTLGGDDFGRVADDAGELLGEKEQALVLHYLVHGQGPVPPPGELMDFTQIPEGAFYGDPFRKRSEIPLEGTFGERAADLVEAGEMMGAMPVDLGDGAIEVQALPLVPITLVMWQGDEEFPPKAKVLFRDNVASLLTADDVAALSGMVIYPLMGMWRARSKP